jgi:hypothetical protein
MTKRRSSISGRGAEILLGEPPPVAIQPRSSDVALTEVEPPGPMPVAEPLADATGEPSPPPTEPEPLLDEAELEALFEEARAGGPTPEEEGKGVSAPPTEPPPTSEVESAPVEEATRTEEPPEPAAEAPVPTLEATMEEKALREEEAIHQPPPPETSDVVSGVLPPRPDRMVPDTGEIKPAAFDIQELEKRVERLELPDRELTEEERQKILAWLGGARIKELEKQIDSVYEEVRRQVGGNEEIATDCYNNLLKARDIVLRRDAAKIAQAEYYVEQVRARLKRAAESEAGAKKYAWWITAWGLLWFVVLLTVLILLNQDWFLNIVAPASTNIPAVDVGLFLRAMIWGGIGGVVAVLYSLFKHVGQRDFDTQYNLSYMGKPFLGVILGATVYMIINLMVLILGIVPAGVEGAGGIATPTIAPWIIYLLAWACGFKENRIFDLVDRVMKRIFSGEQAVQPEPPATPAEPTA